MVVTVAILAVAVFFAGMGVYALAAPARLTAPFDVTLGSATARAEIRAVYGGFGIAIATILIVAAVEAGVRSGVVLTVAAALSGMAVGRVFSLLDGRTAFYPNWFYLVVETVLAVTLFSIASQLRG